jgi:hypothetical protein
MTALSFVIDLERVMRIGMVDAHKVSLSTKMP